MPPALSAYCVIGAAKGLALGVPAPIAVVTGVMTATFGGILRDIVTGEPSVLMRREIYVTAALIGASLYVMLHLLGRAPRCPPRWSRRWPPSAVRGGALHFGWQFPVYRARAGAHGGGSRREAKAQIIPRSRAASRRLTCGRGPIWLMTMDAASEPRRPHLASG